MRKVVDLYLRILMFIFATSVFIPGASASTFYLVATTITGANTKDDAQASSDWYFTVDTGFQLGGGSLVMKDGSGTTYDIYMSLYDLTAGDTLVAQTDMTNAQFKSQVDTVSGQGSNNDQSFNAEYFFFGSTNYSYNSSCTTNCQFGTLGNVVAPDVPYTLVAGHEYDLRLWSNELTNTAYFIKGSTTSTSWSFQTDASCNGNANAAGCSSTELPNGYIGAVSTQGVPEPEVPAMILVGFALMMALRKKRAVAQRLS